VLFIGAVQGLVMQSLVAGGMQGITRQSSAVFSIYEAGLLAMPEPQARKRK
jgi:TetR/AcrR family transcriptional regulator